MHLLPVLGFLLAPSIYAALVRASFIPMCVESIHQKFLHLDSPSSALILDNCRNLTTRAYLLARDIDEQYWPRDADYGLGIRSFNDVLGPRGADKAPRARDAKSDTYFKELDFLRARASRKNYKKNMPRLYEKLLELVDDMDADEVYSYKRWHERNRYLFLLKSSLKSIERNPSGLTGKTNTPPLASGSRFENRFSGARRQTSYGSSGLSQTRHLPDGNYLLPRHPRQMASRSTLFRSKSVFAGPLPPYIPPVASAPPPPTGSFKYRRLGRRSTGTPQSSFRTDSSFRDGNMGSVTPPPASRTNSLPLPPGSPLLSQPFQSSAMIVS